MKIGIFTGGTSVRSKNIFTAISRYPTGKHEIKYAYLNLLCFGRVSLPNEQIDFSDLVVHAQVEIFKISTPLQDLNRFVLQRVKYGII